MSINLGVSVGMVGRMKAKAYPTITLKGVVFVWMGEGEPADPHEDLPPEFFEGSNTLILNTFRYWHCNWMIALENTHDAHNAFYVHRDSLTQLRRRNGGRPRTPLGYPSRIINNKTVNDDVRATGEGRTRVANYYAEKNGGVLPYQMYYPRADGVWPLYRKRLLWTWFFERVDKVTKNWNTGRFDTPEDWQGMRLPGMQRLGFGPPGGVYTRWCVPVEANLTRAVYFRSVRLNNPLTHIWEKVSFKLYRNWFYHYNFSDQDYDAMRSCRYQFPEYLSATDSHLVAERRLITEHARGIKRDVEVAAVTTAERLVLEGHALQGVSRTADEDYAFDEKLAQEPKLEAAPGD